MALAPKEFQKLKHVCWNVQILSCDNRMLNRPWRLPPRKIDRIPSDHRLGEWVATVGFDAAIHEVGMFGNHNSVCAPKTPKSRHTVDRRKMLFPSWNGASSSGASIFDNEA